VLTFTVDTTAPALTLSSLPVVTLGSTLTVGWKASDGASGVASYDVRSRSAAATAAGFSGYVYPRAWQGITKTSVTLALKAGTEYCVSVRARDKVGNTTGWSRETCSTRVLDDRSLRAGTGWSRLSTPSALGGTQTSAGRSGVSLSLTNAHARRVALVVRTCSSCGSVDVYVGSRKLGSVSTYSPTTHYRVVKYLPLQSSSRTGTLLLRTTSARSTSIDAVGLRRT